MLYFVSWSRQRYLCWAKDGRHLQLSVILLFPGVDDQSDVAAATGGKLPECSNNVVLDSKPEPHDVLWHFQSNTSNTKKTFKAKTEKEKSATYFLLVYREIFLAHHELQVIYDDMVDVIHVDSMLHGVQNCPVNSEQK